MKQHILILLAVLLMASCKSTTTIIGGGTGGDKGGKGDGSDIRPGVFTDPEISDFRLNFDGASSKYEKFDGAFKPKSDNSATLKPAFTINDKINEKLGTIRYMNTSVAKIMGYRILIYTGSELNEAQNLESKLKTYFYGSEIDLKYNAPNYTLKAGEYVSRLRAHEVYTKLKEEFPKAIVVSEVIKFDREKFKKE